MAVFFEGLRHHVWITTLKLGVRGRSWEPWCINSRWLFFLKNPVKFFWTFHANTTVFLDVSCKHDRDVWSDRATSHATILAIAFLLTSAALATQNLAPATQLLHEAPRACCQQRTFVTLKQYLRKHMQPTCNTRATHVQHTCNTTCNTSIFPANSYDFRATV